jgi:plastocyanin
MAVRTMTKHAGRKVMPAEGTVEISLSAENLAFSAARITVPAAARVRMNFENSDSGVRHNFALYQDSSAVKSYFVGQIITGPASAVYAFTTPKKRGRYFFRCDVHPTMMTGTFAVI